MLFFDNALKATSMSAPLFIRARCSKKLLLEAYKIAENFEARYSAYKEGNFLYTLNTGACKKAIKCSSEDMTLFKRAVELSTLSEGDFDITIGALSHGAYHFGFKNEALPSEAFLKKQKELVNYKNIVLDESTIFFKKCGTRLDLGGLGKGYVAKKIAQFLHSKDVKHFLINVGGEIVTFGKSYTIGIQDPFSQGNSALFKTTKEITSISSSGNYERFIGSKDNHHILNVKTAHSTKEFSSMTLIQNSIEIDALDAFATAMYNKSFDDLVRFSKKESFATISIDNGGKIVCNNFEVINYKSFKTL